MRESIFNYKGHDDFYTKVALFYFERGKTFLCVLREKTLCPSWFLPLIIK
jgi:hypothetical protein